MSAAPKLAIVPATAERWPDVVTLFGPRGACAGCWCMWPRRVAAEYRAGSGEGNKRALQKLVRGGREPGLLAYAGAAAVGWIAVAPRADYVRLETSRVLAPVDALFDLLEETGSTLRRQAEALQAAGRALEETAELMAGQAEMFERTVGTLRVPADIAKAAAGSGRRPKKSTASKKKAS